MGRGGHSELKKGKCHGEKATIRSHKYPREGEREKTFHPLDNICATIRT
jgi:hypothetical protein